MKLAISTTKGGLEDNVAAVFGRCATFTIVEVDGKEVKLIEVVENEFASATGGAGVQAAQKVANLGVEAIISGNFGPNAFTILDQAGVKLVQADGNVKDLALKYAKGGLKPLDQASRPVFGGMGQGRGGGQGRGCVGGQGHGRGRR
jgi:predicted Fe-Mo cluster-binding NifX family protein